MPRHLSICGGRHAAQEESSRLKNTAVAATLPALDLARATASYRDRLGLTVSEESPAGVTIAAGADTLFNLFPTPNPARGDHPQMGFSPTSRPRSRRCGRQV